MTDSALQRLNMVESQIRPSDITDRRILRGMQTIPREQFVPASLAQLAYMDDAIPLLDLGQRRNGPIRTMMSPRTLAKLLQIGRIEPKALVLDVGCGRGYGAALLAQIATRVVALENNPELVAAAQANLATEKNVTVIVGDLAKGCAEQAPYDVIVVEGAVSAPPAALLAQLKPGGRLVAILASGVLGQATVWQRVGDTYGHATAFEANVAILPGFESQPVFEF